MKSFEKLLVIEEGLRRTFPDGNNPYKIMTRLMEECGELAEQVHIFERDGVKPDKHGEPDPFKMTKEIQDVMICALQVARYYDLLPDLEKAIDRRFEAWLEKEKFTKDDLGRFNLSDWPPRNVLCAGMVVLREDRILLVRQAPGTSLAGQWSLPWGVVEAGESADIAAVRETEEEAGITAEIQGLLGVQNLQWQSATALAFLGKHLSGDPKPDGVETDLAACVALNELVSLEGEVEPWTDWLVRKVFNQSYAVIEQDSSTPFPGLAYL